MKQTFILFLAVIAATTFFSCKKTSDTINPLLNEAIAGGKFLTVDSTLQLKDTVSGGVWTSSDSTIATVTQTGLLTGIKSGIIVVSYNVSGTNGFTSYDTISVTPNVTVIPITGGNSVAVGSSLQLADNSWGGTWATSDSTIASISPTGLVTGVAAGSATITYVVNNVFANFTAAEVFSVH